MGQFAAAFTAFFAMLFTWFRAMDNVAVSAENVTKVLRDASGEYADEATHKRQQRQLELKRQLQLANEANA